MNYNKFIKFAEFFVVLLFFLYPTNAGATISDFKTSVIDGNVQKISFKSDCTKYTTKTSFPQSGPDPKIGPQLTQNIYYSKDGAGVRNLIWFQHGDGGCSSAPREKCEKDYFRASDILSHPKNGKNYAIFCPEMNPSGGDACYKHWSVKYAEFFPCLYNDFLTASKQAGITVTKDVIFASHSQGGPATSHVVLNPPSNIKVAGIIRLDSCYSGQCSDEANLPVSQRGPMFTYASTKPDPTSGDCSGDKFCNSKSNQNATIGKEIYKKTSVAVYKVNNGDHGNVPTWCHIDFLNNDKCGGHAELIGGANATISGGSGPAQPGESVGSMMVEGPPLMEDTELILAKPKTIIKLPGLKFSDIKVGEEDGDKYLYISYLGEYIAAAYKYIVVIASILAVVMIINAGFGIAMSGGNSEKISHSKKRIAQALIGLFIAIESYVMLYTINPNLIKFKSLKVQYLKGERLDNGGNESVLPSDFVYPPGSYAGGSITSMKDAGDPSKIIKDGNNIVYGFNNVPYFSQYDPRWGKKPFGPPDKPVCTCGILPGYKKCFGAPASDPAGDDDNKYGNKCCTDIAHGGCNITSYAMVLRYYGVAADPEITAALAVESGARVCNGGITKKLDSFHKAIMSKWPNMIVEGVSEHQKIIQLLKEKKPIITRDGQAGYTSEGKIREYKGHFMVYTGVDENQKIIFVNDPGNSNPKKGITHISYDQFFAKKITFWYVHPK